MEPGSSVGRYKIEARLCRGGMGEVYRALDPTLRRRVAVKFLFTKAGAVEEARVLREARAAAGLSHPNIVAVHDAGVIDGVCYIVMELIEGQSLRQLLRSGAISRVQTVRWLREIADALSAAHDRGVIHRDVKPENIMISA